jgi:hypothetical protein
MYAEDAVKKRMVLAMGGLLLLAGCGSSANKGAGIPTEPKWKGEPYRLAFDAKAAKPRPDGINIPAVKFTANPEALETRALLVLKFSAAGAGDAAAADHLMIGTAVDIAGDEGTLPDDYMDRARKGLADYLTSYCLKGKVDLSVALARSSLNPQADIAHVDAKRLSDWIPLEITFKNPHPKCK